MVDYTALIAKWPSLSPGTTAQKLAQINSLSTNSTTAIPMVIPTYQIYNLIVPSDFGALAAANQQLVRDILSMGTVDVSPGTSVRARLVAIFTSSTATFTAFAAAAKSYDTPPISWCEANSYSPININDTQTAGLA